MAALAVFAALGCQPLTRRGPAATFEVSASLRDETCGPQSVPLMRFARFRAELGVQSSRATWRVEGRSEDAIGEFDPITRAFRFVAESYLTLRAAERRTGRAACVLRRLDVLEGTLEGEVPGEHDTNDANGIATGDAGSADDAGRQSAPFFRAIETIVYGPIPGADCSDAIGAAEGQFSALPCTQRFDLLGQAVLEGEGGAR